MPVSASTGNRPNPFWDRAIPCASTGFSDSTAQNNNPPEGKTVRHAHLRLLDDKSDNVVSVNNTVFVLMSSHPLGEGMLRVDWSMGAKLFIGVAPDIALLPDPE